MQSIQQIFNLLQLRAAPNLTSDDLATLAGATGYAKGAAFAARDVAISAGCLVQSDENNTGNFQSNSDVPSLLFMLGNAFDMIGSLIEVGENAQQTLDMRRQATLQGKPRAKAVQDQSAPEKVAA